MDPSLLDTDMLNEVLKRKNPNVVRHAADYLAQHGQFEFSAMTWYEVLRGLLEKNAVRQLAQFRVFCQSSVILTVTNDVLENAARLWTEGRKRGLSPKDADLVIAATALENGRSLVTGNTSHFSWIPGLQLENWRLSSTP
jgi:predicted nucleic acid-binding protein